MRKRLTYQLPAEKLTYKAAIHTTELEKHYSQHCDLEIYTVPAKGWLSTPLLVVERKNEDWVRTLPNHADRVVGELQAAYSGLQLKVDGYGQPVAITNQAAVWEQWQVLRDKLAYTYTDEWTAKLLDKTDGTLLHHDELLAVFMKDLIWQEYFRNIYQGDSTQRIVYGIAGAAGIPLQEQHVQQMNSITSSATWKEKHPVTGLKSWKQLKQPSIDSPLSVNYTATYILDPVTQQCAEIKSQYQLEVGTSYKKTIDIHIVK